MKAKNLTEWRQLVLERDNHTCQRCGGKENPLAHHTSYDEPLETANGLTLCPGCHSLERSGLRETIRWKQGQDIPNFLPTEGAFSTSYKMQFGSSIKVCLPKMYLEREARKAKLSLGRFIAQYQVEYLFNDFGGAFMRFKKAE